jgi:uracil phosphoribosyltransferase
MVPLIDDDDDVMMNSLVSISLLYFNKEALAEFPSESVEIITPCGPTLGLLGTDPASICAVSIIRSGDALLEAVRDVEPAVRVGKILIQRDESTPEKTAELFYSKLPPAVSEMHILLCDPMLATGGSAKLAIDDLVKKNQVDPSKIVFCNLVCAPEGLAVLADVYPQVKIVTVIVDEKLNKDKYIVPGLGDFGDRFYSTL